MNYKKLYMTLCAALLIAAQPAIGSSLGLPAAFPESKAPTDVARSMPDNIRRFNPIGLAFSAYSVYSSRDLLTQQCTELVHSLAPKARTKQDPDTSEHPHLIRWYHATMQEALKNASGDTKLAEDFICRVHIIATDAATPSCSPATISWPIEDIGKIKSNSDPTYLAVQKYYLLKQVAKIYYYTAHISTLYNLGKFSLSTVDSIYPKGKPIKPIKELIQEWIEKAKVFCATPKDFVVNSSKLAFGLATGMIVNKLYRHATMLVPRYVEDTLAHRFALQRLNPQDCALAARYFSQKHEAETKQTYWPAWLHRNSTGNSICNALITPNKKSFLTCAQDLRSRTDLSPAPTSSSPTRRAPTSTTYHHSSYAAAQWAAQQKLQERKNQQKKSVLRWTT